MIISEALIRKILRMSIYMNAGVVILHHIGNRRFPVYLGKARQYSIGNRRFPVYELFHQAGSTALQPCLMIPYAGILSSDRVISGIAVSRCIRAKHVNTAFRHSPDS